jgi:predicted MFS family arabinose efflux permease
VNRDFRYYWSAEVSSTFGSTFTMTAIGALGVTTFAATPAELGFVSAAAILPACVFGVFAGVLSDRLRRPRRTLIGCDAAAALIVLLVAAGIFTGAATIWWLAALCFLLGCLSTVIETVYFTHLRGLVPDGDLTAGRVKLQSGEYGARTVGQALAGLVIAAAGGAVALVLDALTYLASLVMLTRIRAADHGAEEPTAGAPRSLLRDIGQGFGVVLRHPFLRAFTAFTAFRSLSVGALATILAPFLLRDLAVPLWLYGALFAFSGLAGLAGSLVAGRLATRLGLRPLAVLGSVGVVASSFVLPLAGGPLPLAASVAVLGLALPAAFGAIANVGLSGAVTDLVPEAVLGRAVAGLRTVGTTAQVLGALGGGLLGGAIGLRPTAWLCAAVSLAGCVLVLRAFTATREPREPEQAPVPAAVG